MSVSITFTDKKEHWRGTDAERVASYSGANTPPFGVIWINENPRDGNSYISDGLVWLGPYTAADVGLGGGGGGGGGLAPNGVIQGAGTYSATAVNGYRVLVAGSANWSLTFSGGGVASVPAAAMTVGDVYPEALTSITVGTGGSALLYIP